MNLRKFHSDFENAISDFKRLKEDDQYISDRQYQLWKKKYAYLAEKINVKIFNYKKQDSFKSLVLRFSGCFNEGRELHIDKSNNKFIQEESLIIGSLLDGKDIPNNPDQLSAIASDENNTLVVAGAGTGKTTTILGKLVYLIEHQNIDPQDILVLSFTEKAVEELTNRINTKLKEVHISVKTFHSFGRNIITQALGKKPSIAFPTDKERILFLGEQFNILLNDKNNLNLAIQYLAYYFKPIVLEPGFKNLDEYNKYISTEDNLSMKKEILKSHQEVVIANFLFLNGISYRYEQPYEHKTANIDYGQYKPDFFLPDYQIYIEHFGINKNGETKFTNNDKENKINSKKYRKQMEWKRNLHATYKTKLIETFSYEFIDGNWREKLTKKLKDNKVKFFPKNENEIKAFISQEIKVKKIIELFDSFLSLSKSSGYTLDDIKKKIDANNVIREKVFFELYRKIYHSYNNYLRESSTIDFHDMLTGSANAIRKNVVKYSIKYIIIDEFQDFSKSKYNLIKALCDQNPEAKLFCVGDDWQSIYRFAGSDVSLMTDFEQLYGFTRKYQLVITNRFNDKLAQASNHFILKNPNQIRKEVEAKRSAGFKVIEVLTNKSAEDAQFKLENILSMLNGKAEAVGINSSINILGRYRHEEPKKIAEYQIKFKNLKIQFLTIHKSKGLESDYVIIVDVVNGKYAFPTEITDDPLLGLVLSKNESYPHAEERRLMYVAMTRARHKVFVMTEAEKKSIFALELEDLGSEN
jgi:DNA helicase-4